MAILLPIGTPTTMLLNVAYALPSVQVRLFTDLVSSSFRQSNTEAFSATTTPTLTDGSVIVASAFLKTVNANCPVILKRS
jgi:hypothetical protein